MIEIIEISLLSVTIGILFIAFIVSIILIKKKGQEWKTWIKRALPIFLFLAFAGAVVGLMAYLFSMWI